MGGQLFLRGLGPDVLGGRMLLGSAVQGDIYRTTYPGGQFKVGGGGGMRWRGLVMSREGGSEGGASANAVSPPMHHWYM